MRVHVSKRIVGSGRVFIPKGAQRREWHVPRYRAGEGRPAALSVGRQMWWGRYPLMCCRIWFVEDQCIPGNPTHLCRKTGGEGLVSVWQRLVEFCARVAEGFALEWTWL